MQQTSNAIIQRGKPKTIMAFRSTCITSMMAGVSRSKNFRLTLKQLRIYKKVRFKKSTVFKFPNVNRSLDVIDSME